MKFGQRRLPNRVVWLSITRQTLDIGTCDGRKFSVTIIQEALEYGATTHTYVQIHSTPVGLYV